MYRRGESEGLVNFHGSERSCSTELGLAIHCRNRRPNLEESEKKRYPAKKTSILGGNVRREIFGLQGAQKKHLTWGRGLRSEGRQSKEGLARGGVTLQALIITVKGAGE